MLDSAFNRGPVCVGGFVDGDPIVVDQDVGYAVDGEQRSSEGIGVCLLGIEIGSGSVRDHLVEYALDRIGIGCGLVCGDFEGHWAVRRDRTGPGAVWARPSMHHALAKTVD